VLESCHFDIPSRGSSAELDVSGGTPFLMTPYRYQKIAKSLILNAVPYLERAPTYEDANCRRGHADGLHSAAA